MPGRTSLSSCTNSEPRTPSAASAPIVGQPGAPASSRSKPPVRYVNATCHQLSRWALVARFIPSRSTLWSQPSQPPGTSHRFTTWGHRPVMPITYHVPRSSKPTFSWPDWPLVCSM